MFFWSVLDRYALYFHVFLFQFLCSECCRSVCFLNPFSSHSYSFQFITHESNTFQEARLMLVVAGTGKQGSNNSVSFSYSELSQPGSAAWPDVWSMLSGRTLRNCFSNTCSLLKKTFYFILFFKLKWSLYLMLSASCSLLMKLKSSCVYATFTLRFRSCHNLLVIKEFLKVHEKFYSLNIPMCQSNKCFS